CLHSVIRQQHLPCLTLECVIHN
ncbi:ribonucleotide reductase, all-alpha domain protein, partial [Chlamydia psittaci C1/97]